MPKRDLVLASTLSLLLAACGGSGGGNPPTGDDPSGGGNQPPVARAGDDLAVMERQAVALSAEASSDADGDSLSFNWSQVGGPSVELSDSSSDAPTFTAPAVDADTELVFEVTVNDGSESTTDRVSVSVVDFALAAEVTGIKTIGFSWPDELPLDVDHFRLLENADGASGYSVIVDAIDGDAAAVSHEVSVHLLDWANASYLLEACVDADCSNPASSDLVVASDLIAEEAIGYVKASNPDAGDWFGTAVALSGDGKVMAVGVNREGSNATGIDGNESDNSAAFAGAVYVFRHGNDSWLQEAYIKADNAEEHDSFGSGVALNADGSVLAVGAYLEDSSATGIDGDGANNDATDSGAAYVFRHDGTEWSQEAYIKASNTGADDYFGWAVALDASGNVLAVSAIEEDSGAAGINGDGDDNAADESGAVYVFRKDGAAWTQEAYVKPAVVGPGDNFGYSIALSADGGSLAVGAHLEDSSATGINNDAADSSASTSGAAYVFRHDGTTWTQEAYVKASNTGAGDRFGTSVGLNGDGSVLAVGSWNESSSAKGVGGDESDNNAGGAGAAYVFRRDGTDWAQEAYIKASNTDGGDEFGYSLSLNEPGDMLAVGAPRENSKASGINGDAGDNSANDAGAVYIYRHSIEGWVQQAYVKAPNTDAEDMLADSMATSADGQTLVVSAYAEDSAASGVNGDQSDNSLASSGAVYIF